MRISTALNVLAILLALPSFLIIVVSDPYRVAAVLVFLIALGIFFVARLLSLDAWTIIRCDLKLEIIEPDGSLVTATKEMQIRANHKGLTEFIHRNIRADGDIVNFRSDSNPVPRNDIERQAGEYIVHERLPREAPRWRTIRTRPLTWEMQKSFLRSHESWGYRVDYSTKQATMEAFFPPNRSPRSPKAFDRLGSQVQELPDPSLDAGGSRIVWEGEKLKVGHQYTIEWDW